MKAVLKLMPEWRFGIIQAINLSLIFERFQMIGF
jgi:hypothetical protein